MSFPQGGRHVVSPGGPGQHMTGRRFCDTLKFVTGRKGKKHALISVTNLPMIGSLSSAPSM